MKTKYYFLLLSLLFGACKKDENGVKLVAPPVVQNPAQIPPAPPDTCSRPEREAGPARYFQHPCGIAVSPKNGEVAISAYSGGYALKGDVIVFASLAAFLTQNQAATYVYKEAKAPEALAFDKDGNLFIAETEGTAGITILKKMQVGYYPLKTIQGGLNNPRGMAFDNAGNLFLCDDGNNRVVRFRAPLTSDVYEPVITGLGSPKGIAVSNNRLFIAEYSGNRISQWKIDSFSAPVATVAVASPVDIAATECFVAVGCPAEKAVRFFHSGYLPLSAGSIAVGSQSFGMLLPAGEKVLTLTSYDAQKVISYAP